MGETTGELRREIETTRQDATEKIEQIEQKVTGAADQVKEQIRDQVTQTKEQVAQAIDWRRQVEERPLLALGAAFLGGVVLSSIFGDDDERETRERGTGTYPGTADYAQYRSGGQRQAQSGVVHTIRNAARNSGLDDTLNNMAAALMASFSDRVKQMADEAFPGIADKLQSAVQGGSSSEARTGASTGSAIGASSSGGGSSEGIWPTYGEVSDSGPGTGGFEQRSSQWGGSQTAN